MTREERINGLSISDEEKDDFINTYKNINENKEISLNWRLKNLIPKSQLLLENRYSFRKNIKCLFVLVGTSIEPLLLSILTIRPSEKLVLIYSSESKKQKKIIENTLLQKSGQHRIQKKWLYDKNAELFIERAKELSMDEVEVKDTNPEKVFAAIKSRTASYQPDEIGVDITGGKKSMVGGGFLAASINNYHLCYVDFDEYNEDKPVQGTEFINILPNPYKIYNIELLSQAKELFRHHNYQASVSLFSKVVAKLDSVQNLSDYGLSNEKEVARSMLIAAKFYMYWDEYSYNKAGDLSGRLDENQKKHLDALKVYEKYQTKKDGYLSPNLYSFVIDRFLSAQRRWYSSDLVQENKDKDDLGSYYDAMLRYFQCVEVMIDAYITINEKGEKYDPDDKQCLLNMDNKKDLCFKGEIERKCKKKKAGGNIAEYKVKYELKKTIPNHKLKGGITELSKHRNAFVHVNQNVQRKDMQKAKLLVKELICYVFDKSKTEIEEDINSFTFKKYFDKNGNLC